MLNFSFLLTSISTRIRMPRNISNMFDQKKILMSVQMYMNKHISKLRNLKKSIKTLMSNRQFLYGLFCDVKEEKIKTDVATLP